MRKTVLLLVALAALLTGCSTGSSAVDVDNGGQFRFVAGTAAGEVIAAADRKTAPSFGGTLLDGTAFASSELSGKIAVLNFWGSWCPPCRVETPQFQQVYADVQAQGVQFLGLNVKDDDQLARAFVTSKSITFPSIYDPKGEVALAFRGYPVNAIPSTVVLDRTGKVAAAYTSEVSEDDLRTTIDDLLKEG